MGSAGGRAAQWRAAVLKCLTAVVLATGAYVFYAHRVTMLDQVEDIVAGPRGADGTRSGGAREEMAKDTPSGLFAAEKLFERALTVHARNAYALVALADIETQLAGAGVDSRASRAAELRARAEVRDIALPERFEARALALLQEGKSAEAETYVRALLARYPHSTGAPRLNDVLGHALRAQGKVREARDSFRKAAGGAREARFTSDLAEALIDEGSFPEAIAAYRFDPSTYADGADALLAAGDPAAAARILDSAASALPKSARLSLARARVEERKGDLVAAQAALDQSLKLDPSSAAAYLVQGRIAEKKREFKVAAQSYARASQLRDDWPEP